MRFHDSKRLAGIGSPHVVILPHGRTRLLPVAQADQHLTATGAFDVHVRRFVLTRWRVDVDPKSAFFVNLDHDGRYNRALGYATAATVCAGVFRGGSPLPATRLTTSGEKQPRA